MWSFALISQESFTLPSVARARHTASPSPDSAFARFRPFRAFGSGDTARTGGEVSGNRE